MTDKNDPQSWTPPRLGEFRIDHLPYRKTHRSPVEGEAQIVDPCHPARATFEILDMSAGGVFLADEERSLTHDRSIRLGLPHAPDAPSTLCLWAWGNVRWRGKKHARDGVGIRLRFDHEWQRKAWRRVVAAFMEARLAPPLAATSC